MKKVESFSRKSVNEIQEVIKSCLSGISDELGVTFSIDGGTFNSDKVKLSLVVQRIDNGEISTSDSTHKFADSFASSQGISFMGHIIGSIWVIKNSVYKVRDISTKSKKYPFKLESSGKFSACSASFLKSAEQVLKPTLNEFQVWFTVDPEDDRVSSSDVRTWDNVQAYMDYLLTKEQSKKFYNIVDRLNEVGAADRKVAKTVYEFLFKNSSPENIEVIYLHLKKIYKEHKV